MSRPAPGRSIRGIESDSPAGAFSVAELTGQIKGLLEGSFPIVQVYGEVLGLTRARSGHVYFTLKDDTDSGDAQISVALWKQRASFLRFQIENGMRVVVSGRVGVYEPRGTYQIIAEFVRPAGQGTLLVAFEHLKQRLSREGLFAPERKRPLPKFPQMIGLVTSPTGAAVHDVLRSIHRKFPARVRLFPVRVQGEGASDDVVAAFDGFERHPGLIDVVIVARGGGSLEDLWTFNEEKVARAVAACSVPTISGIGHEVDVTLADLVADYRAQTPTHAGELVVPSFNDLGVTISQCRLRLLSGLGQSFETASNALDTCRRALGLTSPKSLLAQREVVVRSLGSSLQKSLYNRFREWEDQLALEREKLHALSPLSVLQRGFSLVLDAEGNVVRRVNDVDVGDKLQIKLADGELWVEVCPNGTTSPRDVNPERTPRRRRKG